MSLVRTRGGVVVRVTKFMPAMLLKALVQKIGCNSTVQYNRAALEMTAAVQH